MTDQKELLEALDLLWNSNIIDDKLWKILRGKVKYSNNSMSECERQPVTNNKGNGSKCVHSFIYFETKSRKGETCVKCGFEKLI